MSKNQKISETRPEPENRGISGFGSDNSDHNMSQTRPESVFLWILGRVRVFTHRSIYGGFVQWHMDAAESGEDSIASVVKEAEHWSDLRILILVVSLQKDILVYFFY